MLKYLFSLLFLLFPFICNAGDYFNQFNQQDYVLQSAFVILTLIDLGQTKDIKNHDNQSETHPALSKNPSDEEANFKILSGLLIHTFVVYAMKENWRPFFQIGSIFFEFDAVSHNYSVGLSVRL